MADILDELMASAKRNAEQLKVAESGSESLQMALLEDRRQAAEGYGFQYVTRTYPDKKCSPASRMVEAERRFETVLDDPEAYSLTEDDTQILSDALNAARNTASFQGMAADMGMPGSEFVAEIAAHNYNTDFEENHKVYNMELDKALKALAKAKTYIGENIYRSDTTVLRTEAEYAKSKLPGEVWLQGDSFIPDRYHASGSTTAIAGTSAFGAAIIMDRVDSDVPGYAVANSELSIETNAFIRTTKTIVEYTDTLDTQLKNTLEKAVKRTVEQRKAAENKHAAWSELGNVIGDSVTADRDLGDE